MYSSKRIVWFPVLPLAIQLLSIHSVLSQSDNNACLYHKCCDTEGNFMSKSTYESNLNNLFSSLSYKVSSTGFDTSSSGKPTADNVNGLALCRRDVSPSDCTSCLSSAITELRKKCPYKKAGIVWYDNCLVKYSSTNFFGKIDYENGFYLHNVNNVSDPSSFNKQTKDFLTDLTARAIYGGENQKLFAAGERDIGKNKMLYGLVQCTRDLKSETCESCLNWIIGQLPRCCDGKEGGRVVGGSCNFRYEIYPFIMY